MFLPLMWRGEPDHPVRSPLRPSFRATAVQRRASRSARPAGMITPHLCLRMVNMGHRLARISHHPRGPVPRPTSGNTLFCAGFAGIKWDKWDSARRPAARGAGRASRVPGLAVPERPHESRATSCARDRCARACSFHMPCPVRPRAAWRDPGAGAAPRASHHGPDQVMEIDVRSLRFCIARPSPGMGTERRWLRAARVHEPSATTLHSGISTTSAFAP